MQENTPNKISSGSYDFNSWLNGGYEKDIITTIFGPAGSGKTNLCIMAAASAARKKKKVIFIDTEGGFSAERFRQVCRDDSEKYLSNILILKPTTFEEQDSAFSTLLREIKENNLGLIVIDGMTMLYRLELAEAKRERKEERICALNSKLARHMRILAEIARKRDIPVLATNQVYYEFLSDEETQKGKEREAFMVGGDIMKYWSKCIIELKSERGRRKAILKKHRSLPEKEIDFEICQEGIRKRGWL